jgi:indolepyruvate ferredoxin oxidoreductase
VAIDNNKAAFEWGCRAACDGLAVQRALSPGQVIHFTAPNRSSLEQMVQTRASFLKDYQNSAYADSYRAFVAQVQAAEIPIAADGRLKLTEAVARYLFKLMAYKDEYEVARLHTAAAFSAKVSGMFEGDFKLHYHLAPPLFAQRNNKGELQKVKLGPWMRPVFALLARFKVLRGGPLDIFGYSAERKQERVLLQEYRGAIAAVLPKLNAQNRTTALAFAGLPEHIRGFGHVKARHLGAIRKQWAELIAALH